VQDWLVTAVEAHIVESKFQNWKIWGGIRRGKTRNKKNRNI